MQLLNQMMEIILWQGISEIPCGGGADIYCVKVNENGDTLWTKTFSENGNNVAHSVQVINDASIVITGECDGNNPSPFYRMFWLKTDNNGDKIDYSNIEVQVKNISYKIPNPIHANELFDLFRNFKEDVRLYDISGNIIKNSDIKTGIYLYSLKAGNSEIKRCILILK